MPEMPAPTISTSKCSVAWADDGRELTVGCIGHRTCLSWRRSRGAFPPISRALPAEINLRSQRFRSAELAEDVDDGKRGRPSSSREEARPTSRSTSIASPVLFKRAPRVHLRDRRQSARRRPRDAGREERRRTDRPAGRGAFTSGPAAQGRRRRQRPAGRENGARRRRHHARRAVAVLTEVGRVLVAGEGMSGEPSSRSRALTASSRVATYGNLMPLGHVRPSRAAYRLGPCGRQSRDRTEERSAPRAGPERPVAVSSRRPTGARLHREQRRPARFVGQPHPCGCRPAWRRACPEGSRAPARCVSLSRQAWTRSASSSGASRMTTSAVPRRRTTASPRARRPPPRSFRAAHRRPAARADPLQIGGPQIRPASPVESAMPVLAVLLERMRRPSTRRKAQHDTIATRKRRRAAHARSAAGRAATDSVGSSPFATRPSGQATAARHAQEPRRPDGISLPILPRGQKAAGIFLFGQAGGEQGRHAHARREPRGRGPREQAGSTSAARSRSPRYSGAPDQFDAVSRFRLRPGPIPWSRSRAGKSSMSASTSRRVLFSSRRGLPQRRRTAAHRRLRRTLSRGSTSPVLAILCRPELRRAARSAPHFSPAAPGRDWGAHKRQAGAEPTARSPREENPRGHAPEVEGGRPRPSGTGAHQTLRASGEAPRRATPSPSPVSACRAGRPEARRGCRRRGGTGSRASSPGRTAHRPRPRRRRRASAGIVDHRCGPCQWRARRWPIARHGRRGSLPAAMLSSGTRRFAETIGASFRDFSGVAEHAERQKSAGTSCRMMRIGTHRVRPLRPLMLRTCPLRRLNGGGRRGRCLGSLDCCCHSTDRLCRVAQP